MQAKFAVVWQFLHVAGMHHGQCLPKSQYGTCSTVILPEIRCIIVRIDDTDSILMDMIKDFRFCPNNPIQIGKALQMGSAGVVQYGHIGFHELT